MFSIEEEVYSSDYDKRNHKTYKPLFNTGEKVLQSYDLEHIQIGDLSVNNGENRKKNKVKKCEEKHCLKESSKETFFGHSYLFKGFFR